MVGAWIGFVATGGAALLALFLFYLGIRGRQRGIYPHCRTCDYDLTGLPMASGNCPECGRDLRRARAIRIGSRRRRPIIATAVVILLIGATGWGVPGLRQWTESLKWVPGPLLFYSLHHFANPSLVRSAEAEIIRRYDAGSLDRALLLTQLDHLPVIWPSGQRAGGRIVEVAELRGDLSAALWSAYCQSLCTVWLEVRPRVQQGMDVPMAITLSAIGNAEATNISGYLSTHDISLDNFKNKYHNCSFWCDFDASTVGPMTWTNEVKAFWDRVPRIGIHTARATVRVSMGLTIRGREFQCDFDRYASADFTSISTPTVQESADPKWRARMRASLGPPSLGRDDNNRLILVLPNGPVPRRICCRIIARVGGNEIEMYPPGNWGPGSDPDEPEGFGSAPRTAWPHRRRHHSPTRSRRSGEISGCV